MGNKKIKYFNDFLNESVKNIDSIKEWAYEYVKTNFSGLNSYEDGILELDYLFKEIDDFGDNIILHRVINSTLKN